MPIPAVTYVLSTAYPSGVSSAKVSYGAAGQTFDVLAALVAGGGNAKGVGGSFSVTDADIAAALDQYPVVTRSGVASTPAPTQPVIGPLVASLLNPAAADGLVYGSDGVLHNTPIPAFDANGKVPWALLAGHVVNVLDAEWNGGAKGDSNAAGTSGTADQAAINAAIASLTTGGTVFVPRAPGGNGYRLTGPIIIDRDDITLEFEGKAAQLILAPGSNSNVIRGNSSSDTADYGVIRKNRVEIRGLYAEMGGLTQTASPSLGGAVVLPGFNFIKLENCYVHNARDLAYDLRGSAVVRATECVADSVFYGGAANGFAVGMTGRVAGVDAEFTNCHAIGVQDVAFFMAGYGGRRVVGMGCIVRSDATRYFSDGAINVAVNASLFTSASAGFTEKDVGKVISVPGAGPAGATLTCRIYDYVDPTTIHISVNASTTVSGANFSYGADLAPAKRVIDAQINSSSTILNSNRGVFNPDLVGKSALVVGAGPSGANLRCRITGYTSATQITLETAASTSVTNAVAIVNCTYSGMLAEGSLGNSDHISLLTCHVIGTVNNGMGGSDASGGITGSKHDQFSILGGSISETYGAALWFTGTQYTQSGLHIDNFHDTGIILGDGNDFAEGTFSLSGGSIKAAADATGNGLTIRKDGTLTNWLSNVTISNLVLDGNGGGGRGVSIEGKVRIIDLIGVQSKRWKNSGLHAGAKSGAAPVDLRITGGDYRNNNQANNAAGANSVGMNFEGGTDNVSLTNVRGTDDQAVKTQTHGFRWNGATRGTFRTCDFRGNATAAFSAAFDSLTIYDSNKDIDAAYEGGATLVAGTVTVNTAAVKNSGGGSAWTQIEVDIFSPSANAGALYVSAVSSGTSFTVKSTNASDTSSFFWRLRTHA